jgi:3-hydroxyisobutyrate dehydrogenase
VITCVSDGAAIAQIVFGEKGVAEAGSSEKVLIDMSTCAAVHTEDMASPLTAKCGMAWLDAPISGGAPAALKGRMAVMIGGREAAKIPQALSGGRADSKQLQEMFPKMSDRDNTEMVNFHRAKKA